MAHHVVMKRRFAASAAWLGATVVSILLASAAVATVRSEISERPSPLRATALDQLASSTTAPPSTVAGEEPPTTIPSSTTTAASSTQTVSTAPPTTVPVTTTTTMTGSVQSTTTTTVGAAQVTTTTAPPVVTTSTTTTQAQGEPQSYELTGGFVQILVSSDSVVVRFATPKPGFSVDIKKFGPPDVDVRFEGEDHTSVFKAEIESGALDVDLTEQDKGGDD